ncbi:MAG: hypothetical protein PHY92_07165 [Alphaproteobacteria bacterium]|nr:hypothetical protein [Alphaproteobacteria bacterium]
MNFLHRDDVFIAGGQPTVTYVDREDQDIERTLARAIAAPNQIASLAGPTKTGKTVLCKKALSKRDYIWIDGGKIKTASDFWETATSELNIPTENSLTQGSETSITAEGSIPFITTAGGSHLSSKSKTETFKIDSMSRALEYMTHERIILVIDDFHYIPAVVRTDIMRNVKGAVFNGLKVLLLSVTHRVFDAIKAESELTGRFTTVTLPHWTKNDLKQIPLKGFGVLGVNYDDALVDKLCDEAQENPFLMQKFCWEICYDCEIERKKIVGSHEIPKTYDLKRMCKKLAHDAGLPIYKKLAAGPQSRKLREKRPLKVGGDVDIYEVTLLAIAETGPKSTIKYDELRDVMNGLLEDKMPQKHEITAALKQLTNISREIGAESAIDWNEDTREITVADPYLRFYLRWQVRQDHTH